MIKKNIWLTAVLAAILFFSGMVAGFFVGRINPSRTRRSAMAQQSPEKVKAMVSSHILQRLKLTDAQRQVIAPAVDAWFDRLSELRRRHSPEFLLVFTDFFDRIAPALNPEQQSELVKIRQETLIRISNKGKVALPH